MSSDAGECARAASSVNVLRHGTIAARDLANADTQDGIE
jgi:hypothetical protein